MNVIFAKFEQNDQVFV